MSNTNFTPGPWSVNTSGFSSCADWTETFSVKGPPSDFMYLENIADAHLIAAAPCMYEALQNLMSYVDGLCGSCGAMNAPAEVYIAARESLAKARGEN